MAQAVRKSRQKAIVDLHMHVIIRSATGRAAGMPERGPVVQCNTRKDDHSTSLRAVSSSSGRLTPCLEESLASEIRAVHSRTPVCALSNGSSSILCCSGTSFTRNQEIACADSFFLKFVKTGTACVLPAVEFAQAQSR